MKVWNLPMILAETFVGLISIIFAIVTAVFSIVAGIFTLMLTLGTLGIMIVIVLVLFGLFV